MDSYRSKSSSKYADKTRITKELLDSHVTDLAQKARERIQNKDPEIKDGIPLKLYDILPEILGTRCCLIDESHKRDIFLTSALPVIAGHLCNVEILHADGRYTPDLFTLIVASPGTGKGISSKARKLGNELQRYLLEKSEQEQQQFDMLDDAEKAGQDPPKTRCLFIPANSSSRAMYNQMEANGGNGVLFENEIDTMLNATKQEWGDFSDICRKAFHHESVSLNRKENQFRIDSPRLSICLTGTYDQFRKMFSSAENGYFSRFAMYSCEPERKWQSHRPTQRTNEFNSSIGTASVALFDLWEILKAREQPITVELSGHQWDSIDEVFGNQMQHIDDTGLSELLHASNNRAAIIALRITSILTILRAYETDHNKLDKVSITPDSRDVKAGITLGKMFVKQAINLFELLPNNSGTDNSRGQRYVNFIKVLPPRFETKEAVEVGKKLEIPKRTVYRWLNDSNELKKVKHGVYAKL